MKNLPLWVKIGGGLLLLALLVVLFYPRPQPKGYIYSNKEEKRLRFQRDSLLQEAARNAKLQRAQDSTNRVNAQASNQAAKSYNQTVIIHKTQNEAHKALPRTARYAADVRTIRGHRPKPCKYCDSLLAEE